MLRWIFFSGDCFLFLDEMEGLVIRDIKEFGDSATLSEIWISRNELSFKGGIWNNDEVFAK